MKKTNKILIAILSVGGVIFLTGLIFTVIVFMGYSVARKGNSVDFAKADAVPSEKYDTAMDDTAIEEMGDDYKYEAESGNGAATPELNSVTYVNSAAMAQKLIIRNSLRIETTNFDEYIKDIESLTTNHKGFIEEQNIYNGSLEGGEVKHAFYMLRIPKTEAEKFNSDLLILDGKIVDNEKSIENITSKYLDLKRRVDVTKIKEDRLIKLLKKAEYMEDIIKLEKEIADLISEREEMQSEMLKLNQDVKYDYYSVDIAEVRKYQEVKKENNFGADLRYALGESVDGMIGFFQNVVLFFAYSWTFWVILIIVVIVIVKLIKRNIRKKRARLQNSQSQNKEA